MSPADAKKTIDAAKAREEAEKTEAQKTQEALATAQAEAAAAKAEAAGQLHSIAVERALRAAGSAAPELVVDLVKVPRVRTPPPSRRPSRR
jgi:hypothetical protein